MVDEISIKASQEEINNELRSLYQKNSSKLKKLVQDYKGASCPHLLFIPSSYLRCKNKLLVVGQQTNGWDCSSLISCCSDIVVSLMKEYEEFNLGEKYVSSPFWQASIEFNQIINPDDKNKRAFLWSNLIKIDQDEHRPEPQLEEAVTSLNLLQSEIRIAKPNVVVCFTGPYYDERLRSSFPKIEFVPVNPNIATRQLAKLVHQRLPELSFRTYHPKYLKLSHKWCLLKSIGRQIISD